MACAIEAQNTETGSSVGPRIRTAATDTAAELKNSAGDLFDELTTRGNYAEAHGFSEAVEADFEAHQSRGLAGAVMGTVIAVILTAIIASIFLNLDLVQNNTMFGEEMGQLESIIGTVLVLFALVPLVAVATRLMNLWG